jgi:hypothetical protein
VHLEPQGMAENLIRVKLPAQRYFRPGVRKSILDSNKRDKKYGLNSTIYKFNLDYINNIQILKPKILLVGMLNELLGLGTSIIKSADIDITQKMIDAKLSSAIKSVIEADDMEVENCYMEFSNDELNDMLEEMLLARYNATIYGGEKNIAVTRDINDYIGMIDQVAKNASIEGTTTTITKMVTKVTVDNNVVEPSLNYGLGYNGEQNILKKLLWAIVRPIIMALFTPQVLLLIYINFELLGITNVNETLGPQDFGKIVNFLMNKIFSLIKSIMRFVKDIILEILLELFLKYVLPKLIKWKLLLYIEKITYWLALLKAAISCLPIFKFKLPKIISSIDNVNYADIIEEQKTPESDSPC